MDDTENPKTGAERLAELDKKWVPDSPLYDGKIERGIGSPYSKLKPEQKKHYEAVEALIVAEQKVADAQAALKVAEDGLIDAQHKVDTTAV